MHTRTIVFSLCLLTVTFTVLPATITVNTSASYQTIEGFGAFGESVQGEFHADAIGDLGLTMVRTNVPHDDLGREINYLKNMNNAAKAAGVDLKVIASCWTPPTGMKVNGRIDGLDGATNILKDDAYDDFGQHCVNFIKKLKQDAGIDLYAISLQNEPQFPEPYVSCVYTSEAYAKLLKVSGSIIKSQVPGVKVFGSETMLQDGNAYLSKTFSDTTTRRIIDNIAYHGYSDGVTPTSTATASVFWARVYGLAKTFGKKVWMTETSGYDGSWNSAVTLSLDIYTALVYGNLSAWTWWSLNNPGSPSEGLMSGSGNKQAAYYASKHFYKFIRPGAIRIGCSNNDSTAIMSTAFIHTGDRTLTIVAINSSSSDKNVSFTLPGSGGTFKWYLSSSSRNCADMGTIQTNSSVTMPGKSIATFQLSGTSLTVAALRPVPVFSDVNNTGSAGQFLLNGKFLEKINGPLNRSSGVKFTSAAWNYHVAGSLQR